MIIIQVQGINNINYLVYLSGLKVKVTKIDKMNSVVCDELNH